MWFPELAANASNAVGLARDLGAVRVREAGAARLARRADESRPQLLTAGVSGECPATLGVGGAGGQIGAAVPVRIAHIPAHYVGGSAGAIAADAGAAGVFHAAGGAHRNTGSNALALAIADQPLRRTDIDALAILALLTGVLVAFS